VEEVVLGPKVELALGHIVHQGGAAAVRHRSSDTQHSCILKGPVAYHSEDSRILKWSSLQNHSKIVHLKKEVLEILYKFKNAHVGVCQSRKHLKTRVVRVLTCGFFFGGAFTCPFSQFNKHPSQFCEQTFVRKCILWRGTSRFFFQLATLYQIKSRKLEKE
jgi:hypothetical protein